MITKFKYWQKSIGLVLLTIIASTLLIVIPSINIPSLFHSSITSKTWTFIYGLIILACIIFISFISRRNLDINFKLTKIDIILLSLILFIIINRYILQPEYSFSIRFIELLGLSVFYLIFRFLPLNHYPWLFLALIFSGFIQGLHGSLQIFGYSASLNSNFKVSGSFFNPGPYSGFLASVWPISFCSYLYRKRIIKIIFFYQNLSRNFNNGIVEIIYKYVSLFSILIILIILPATRSRAAWSAVFISTVIILGFKYKIWYRFKNLTVMKKQFLCVSLFITVIIGSIGLYKFKESSANGRLLIWTISTNLIDKNPLIGVGYDNFRANYMYAQAEYFRYNQRDEDVIVSDNTYYAFNEPLQFLIENGILGIIPILLLIYHLTTMSNAKENNILKLLCLSTLSGLIIFSLFSYPSQILPIKLVWITILAMLAKLSTKNVYNIKIIYFRKFHGIKLYFLKVCLIFTFLVLISSTIYEVQKTEQAFKNWKNAMVMYNINQYKLSVDNFKKAYPILHRKGDFLMNYGKALSMIGKYESSIKVLERAKKYLAVSYIEIALGDSHKALGNDTEAEKAYINAMNMTPNQFYSSYLLAKLYNNLGQTEKARTMAKSILTKKVKVPSKAIREIKNEMRRILEDI